jgi:peptidoglycan/LPS O-acetylase OafA/YrhL
MPQNVDSAPTQKVANLRALTGVRALAAFWVVALHYTRFDERYYNLGVANELVRAGGLGVTVFFVLSGFIMTHVYRSRFRSNLSFLSWGEFLQNRVARLYPVHVVSALTMLGFAMVGWRYGFIPHGASFSPLSMLANITMTQVWFRGVGWFHGVGSMNGVSWSISAEWFAYLLFPIVYFSLWKIGDSWPWIVAAVVVVACHLAHTHGPLVRISAEFPLGMVAYELQLRKRHTGFGKSAGILIMLTYLVALYYISYSYYAVATSLTSALLFSALVAPTDIFGRLLSTKVLVYLGEISYSIYMWHMVVWIFLRRGMSVVLHVQVVPRLWLIALGLLLTLAVSSLSYHFIEEPGRKAIRKLRWVGSVPAPQPRLQSADN